MRTVALDERAVKRIRKGRPRIELELFPRGSDLPPPGIWIRLTDRQGRYLALGLMDRDRRPFCRIVHYPGGEEGNIPDPAFYREKVEAACALREQIFRGSPTTAYRILNGEGDGIPGLIMDRYGDFAVAWEVTPGLHSLVKPVCKEAMKIFKLKGIYKKGQHREGYDPDQQEKDKPYMGEAAPKAVLVREGDMHLEARLSEGPRTGVYTDQRENRELLAPLCKGIRVLNTFSYTGAFSAAAALAGASGTVSVDLSRRALSWSRRNFQLNNLDLEPHRHVKADVFDYLNLARKKGFFFGMIILDPVTFSTSKKGLFRAEKDWPRLLEGSLRLLDPGGWLALSCNTRTLSEEMLLDFLQQEGVKAGRTIRIEAIKGLPRDYPVHTRLPRMQYLKFILARCS